MDTYMTVTAYGENADKAAEQAENRIHELDAELSTGIEDSLIAVLNKKGSAELTKDAAYLMKCSLELWKKTDGAFNPAIYPVMEEWGFTTKEYKIPDNDILRQKVQLSDASKIKFDENSGRTEFEIDGMKVDFGGIAKGYTSSEIMHIFEENGITSGIVSLGGNVQVLGSKTDGSPWRVAIQNPNDDDSYIGILEIKDKAVITSGSYERYFIEDGKTYHHIINPDTGYPAESGLKSVTIVSDDGTLADGLSTSLFVMGFDKAKLFWSDNSDKFDAILLTDEEKLYVTEGITDSFDSDMDMTIIEKED
ncbi:MAG: FAD:protein FMN transferase [Lachnospiraceae bacterium]|nr:FAD:protein FMN transferase [Lachnospiraceae bacterium]